MSNHVNDNFFSREGLSLSSKIAGVMLLGITAMNGLFELVGEHTELYKYPVGVASGIGFYALGKVFEPRSAE